MPTPNARCPRNSAAPPPDFIIVGAQKGGTIALWENLNLHPEVHLPFDRSAPTPREKHFFDLHWDNGVDWYRDQFPRTDLLQGEKTPNYMTHPLFVARMAATAPDAKLICLLRNPVERAYSSWNMMAKMPRDHWNHTALPFDRAVLEIPSLISRGRYCDQLEWLLTHYPRERIFVGISERFRRDLDTQMRAVLSFLEVSELTCDWAEHHVRQYPGPMSETVRRHLSALFAPSNERLFELLGEEIGEWL